MFPGAGIMSILGSIMSILGYVTNPEGMLCSPYQSLFVVLKKQFL